MVQWVLIHVLVIGSAYAARGRGSVTITSNPAADGLVTSYLADNALGKVTLFR